MQSFAPKQTDAHKRSSSAVARPHTDSARNIREVVPQLQRTLGNQAVQRLLQDHESNRAPITALSPRSGYDAGAVSRQSAAFGPLPGHVTVSQPGDRLEQEADQIAERAMASPAYPEMNSPSRDAGLSRPRNGVGADSHTGSGKPMDPVVRREMEQRFGRDFSGVRVHSGPVAETSAQILHAKAYTVGNDIVFGAGQFAPHTPQGRRLIAHELAHVMQQHSAGFSVQRQPAGGAKPAPHDPFDVYDQLDIIREAQLPLEFFERAEIRKLSFEDRQTLEFKRKLEAIVKLGDFKDERAVKTLIGVLEDTVPGVKSLSADQKLILQQTAAESLAKIGGKAALAKLNDLLNSKDPKQRMMAGRGFSGEGVAGGQSVVDLLAALKKEKDPDIKSQIISALGRIGAGSGDKEKEAIAKELIEVMDSATGPVLPAAINALGRLKTQTATEPLLNQLRLNLGIDSLVEDIVRALGEIRDPKAVDLVVIMLEKHSKQAIRIEAAIALGKIRGHKALEALKRRLNQETDSNVKAEIAKAIHTPPVSLHWTFN